MNKMVLQAIADELLPDLAACFSRLRSKTWDVGPRMFGETNEIENSLFSFRFFVLGIETARLWQQIFQSSGLNSTNRIATHMDVFRPFFELFYQDYYLNTDM